MTLRRLQEPPRKGPPMKLRMFMLIACGALSAACGGATTKTAGNAAVDPNNAGNQNGPIILAERVTTDTAGDTQVYLTALAGVPTASVDRSRSLELRSADLAVFSGSVYVRDRNASVVTRYNVGSDLQLHRQDQVSFANFGIDTAGRTYDAFLSPAQAYALDSKNMRLIEWNPTTLELTGKVIDVSGYIKSGVSFAFGPPQKSGARVYVPITWSNDSSQVVYPKMAVMIVDGLGGLPPIIEDARVGPAFALFADGAGNIYAPGIISAAYRRFGTSQNGGAFPPDGVLKLVPNAATFESSYTVDLSATVKSSSISAAWYLDDAHVLVQGVDPNADTSAWASSQDVANSNAFIYAMVNTQTNTSMPVSAIPKGGAASTLPHGVDGTIYAQTLLPSGTAQIYAVQRAHATAAFQVPGGVLWHLERVQ